MRIKDILGIDWTAEHLIFLTSLGPFTSKLSRGRKMNEALILASQVLHEIPQIPAVQNPIHPSVGAGQVRTLYRQEGSRWV